MAQTMQEKRSKNMIMGYMAAVAFAAGPFLYLNIGGRGLFLYIAVIFILAIGIKILLNHGVLDYCVPTVFWPYLLFIIWQFIGFIWSPQNSGKYIFDFSKILVFVILLCMNAYSAREKKLIHITQTATAIFLVIMMLTGEQTSEQGRYIFNMFGVAQDPNYMCFFLLMPFYWCLHTVMNNKTEKRIAVILSFAALIVLTTGFLATGSRGALFGLLMGVSIYLLTYRKMSIKRFLLILLFVVVAIFILLQIMHFLPDEITSRFRLEGILKSEGSGRYKIWRRYIQLIFDNGFYAIFGHGTYSCLDTTATHNYVLEILYENGFIGLVLALVFYIKLIRQFVRTKNWMSLAALTGALAMAMTLSVGSMLQFWLCIASTIVLNHDESGEIPEQKEM